MREFGVRGLAEAAYSFLAFRNGGFFDMISNLMGLNIIQHP
jgi:hypothetical protein